MRLASVTATSIGGTEYAEGCIRFFLLVQARVAGLSPCHSHQVSRKGRRFRQLQTVADWTQAGVSGHRDTANVRVGLAEGASRSTPFAPPYVSYTHRLRALIEDLRGFMTVADLAAVLGLSWDTVKNIIKRRLEKDYGQPRLKDLHRLSIDEIYLGAASGFGRWSSIWTAAASSGQRRGVELRPSSLSGRGCAPTGPGFRRWRWT